MLLIIPSIHIRSGKCLPPVDYFSEHHLPEYDHLPERTRILRMENAKAIHLFFEDTAPYSDKGIAIIKQIRTAIDIPLGISLDHFDSHQDIQRLFDNGIYRITISCQTPEETIKELIKTFTAQRFSFLIPNKDNILEDALAIKLLGGCRIKHQLNNLDDLDEIRAISEELLKKGLRLTLISRVSNYTELMLLQDLSPVVDSIILDDTLEHDVFPCQKIWRLAEERAFNSKGIESNLWKNPLEKAHN